MRASCLSFFEGLERLHDGFNIYYSTRAVNWFGALLFEIAIVEARVVTTDEFDEDENLLLETLSTALSKFNPDPPFGANDEPLYDCIRLVQRARFKHYPADLIPPDVAAISWGEKLMRNEK